MLLNSFNNRIIAQNLSIIAHDHIQLIYVVKFKSQVH